MKPRVRVAVLGGLGMMGEACLHDLARQEVVDGIEIVDLNKARARSVLARLPHRRKVRVHSFDFTDHAQARRRLKDCRVLINCAWYELNLKAMDLALALGAHYVDLGGLYHTTLKQLARSAEFKRKGLLAIVGAGSTPGITNMLAARLGEEFQRVCAVRIYDSSVELRPADSGFVPPFSIRTMMDEYELPAPVLRGGRLRMVQPFSEEEEVEFAPPLGRGRAALCIHSELATLPGYFRAAGVREMFFKIVYPEPVRAQLHMLVSMGFSKDEPLGINGARVSPRRFLSALALQGAAESAPPPSDCEVLRVELEGARGGRPLRKGLDCSIRHTRALSAGAMGVGYTASIAALMAASGRTLAPAGVFAPESALPQAEFFCELHARRVFSLTEYSRLPVQEPL